MTKRSLGIGSAPAGSSAKTTSLLTRGHAQSRYAAFVPPDIWLGFYINGLSTQRVLERLIYVSVRVYTQSRRAPSRNLDVWECRFLDKVIRLEDGSYPTAVFKLLCWFPDANHPMCGLASPTWYLRGWFSWTRIVPENRVRTLNSFSRKLIEMFSFNAWNSWFRMIHPLKYVVAGHSPSLNEPSSQLQGAGIGLESEFNTVKYSLVISYVGNNFFIETLSFLCIIKVTTWESTF